MSHHVPYYASAPLGQTTAVPTPTPIPTSSAMVVSSPIGSIWRIGGLAAGAALAYHGYKRNNSVGWALVWAIAGGLVWPASLAIAFAQGFGKTAVRSNRSRRSRRRR